MINESNNSLETILQTTSEEHLQHQKFQEELDKKQKQTQWYWKMLGVTVVIAVVWITISSWWFESGSKETAESKHIRNPYVSR